MQSLSFQSLSHTCCTVCLSGISSLICLHILPAYHTVSALTNADSFQPLSHTCCTVCLSGISFHICLHILPANHTVSALTNADSFQPLSHTCCNVCLSGISSHICLHILPAYHTVSAKINAEPFFSAPLTHVLYRLFVRHLFSHMFAHLACQPHRICINQHRAFLFSPSHTRVVPFVCQASLFTYVCTSCLPTTPYLH